MVNQGPNSEIKILVVDDEQNLADLLSAALRYEGWDVRATHDGITAINVARKLVPDVLVLDIMLPDIDGLNLMRKIRNDIGYVPVLFLTAKDAVEDRVTGLMAGGDDYVTKPFSLEEVVARIRVLLRRVGRVVEESESILQVGDLILNEESREVSRGGEEIHLSSTEFDLLRYLMLNERRALSKSTILDRVWNFDFGGNSNVVELYISYLRKKIDKGRPPMIHTIRNVGYILKPADGES